MRWGRMSLLGVVIILLFSFYSRAQNLPKKVMRIPAKYVHPTNVNDLEPVSDSDRAPYVWTVYSDRDNNISFVTPNKRTSFKRLKFLDKFYVCEEEGEFVHIVKDPDISGFNLSPQVENYGWIKKSHLLLWGKALVTPKGHIAKKAMILNTINQLSKQNGRPDVVEYRSSPSKEGPKTGKASRLFEILFIFKKVDVNNDSKADFYLLAKSERIPEGNREERMNTVLGWAPVERLTFWNHRIALEPNWEKVAVDERKQTGKKAKFFVDFTAAQAYELGKTVPRAKILWDNDPLSTERPIGEWRRFPILREKKQQGGKFVTGGVMGEIFSPQSNSTIDENEIAIIQRKIDELESKKRNISIVFVIDGTNSMGPYFPAISQALQQSVKNLGRQGTRNHFKFGAVVYRDWAEGRDRLTEVAPLGSDVVSFLKNVEARDLRDQDTPEAVYYGLEQALRGTGITPNETNIVVLIGDAGNHHRQDGSQVDPREIVDALENLEANFLVFQVHHESHPSYNEFITQTKSLIMETAQNIYQKDAPIANSLGQHFPEPRWDDSHAPIYKLTGGSYYGQVFGLNQGSYLTPEKLSDYIKNFINDIDQNNNKLISALEDIKAGSDIQSVAANKKKSPQDFTKFSSPLSAGIIQLLRQAGLSEDQIQKAQVEKYQLYTRGVAPLDVNGLKHPLFKKVLFLSRMELGRLVDIMYRLGDKTSAQGLREAFKKNWVAVIKSEIGNISEEEIENKSIGELHKMLMDIPPASKMLRNISLRDILNPDKVTDDELVNYVNEITEKANKLGQIFNMDDNRYSFRSNEVRYYWIPVEMIP